LELAGGVAVVSEPLQKIPAKNVIFRDLAPEDRGWVPVGAAWKPDALTAPVASQFIDVLAQACANGNGRSRNFITDGKHVSVFGYLNPRNFRSLAANPPITVSYTHLTLPTICSV